MHRKKGKREDDMSSMCLFHWGARRQWSHGKKTGKEVATKIQQAIERKIKKDSIRLLTPLPPPPFLPVLSLPQSFCLNSPNPFLNTYPPLIQLCYICSL